ncbi:MAG: Rieske (2Fe-2S) protein, partial [Actinomycetota bacterium]|nr:Rieske (2Fe-2S) protein [Actinomycetota bacterium]
MSREKLIALAREHIEYALEYERSGKNVLADDVFRIPVTNYFDSDRWAAEMELIFKRVPLVLGFTVEIPKAGDYKAMEVAGVPLILVRGRDDVVRGFVNMCSHRGAQIMDNGNGSTRSFSCPYHAWTYNLTGDLVAILDDQDFGEVDTSCMGLTPLTVEERVGIIWGSITPGADLHLDEFLAGYDDLLDNHGLADCVFVGRQSIEGPNWKVAYDG